MKAGHPLSRWIRPALTGLLLLATGILGYWFYAPVSHWSACGLSSSSSGLSFKRVEPTQATLLIVVTEKNTNRKWRQYWAVHNATQDSLIKLHAGMGRSKQLFGQEIPYQRRTFLTYIQPGRDAHGAIKSFTYDVTWMNGNN